MVTKRDNTNKMLDWAVWILIANQEPFCPQLIMQLHCFARKGQHHFRPNPQPQAGVVKKTLVSFFRHLVLFLTRVATTQRELGLIWFKSYTLHKSMKLYDDLKYDDLRYNIVQCLTMIYNWSLKIIYVRQIGLVGEGAVLQFDSGVLWCLPLEILSGADAHSWG